MSEEVSYRDWYFTARDLALMVARREVEKGTEAIKVAEIAAEVVIAFRIAMEKGQSK